MSGTDLLLNTANLIINYIIPTLLSPRVLATPCLIASASLKLKLADVTEPYDKRDKLSNLIITTNDIVLGSSAIAICTGSTFLAATSFALFKVNLMMILIASRQTEQIEHIV